MSFCTDLEFPHFFYELIQIIQLSCSNTLTHNLLMYVPACILGGVIFLGIIFSHVYIVSSILQMPASKWVSLVSCFLVLWFCFGGLHWLHIY
jgi:olfactory receptor